MNETFNFKRFWLVLKEELLLTSKPMIINTLLTLMLVGVTMYSLYHYEVNTTMGFNVILMIVSILGVWILSSRVYGIIRSKTAFASYYTKPASILEKFLSRLIVSNIMPVLIWVLLLVLLESNDRYYDVFIRRYRFVDEVVCYVLLGLTPLFFFWGVACRARFGFFVCILVIALAAVGITYYFSYGNMMFLDPIWRFVYSDPGRVNCNIVMSILIAVVGIASFVAAYFVFRSRQMDVKIFKW